MKPPTTYRRVYAIGLGGVGVSAVAKLLMADGAKVSGSDPQTTPLTEDIVRLGGQHFTAPDPSQITSDLDLVITTDDAPDDHPERLAAQRQGVPCENFSVTLGRLMAGYPQRLTVAGTNGKSTTTAMAGLLLTGAGMDPTVFVGSRVPEFQSNLRLGGRGLFVAEADEYRDHYLQYQSTVGLITNLEPDHLDYFGSWPAMVASYQRHVDRIPEPGALVLNADDQAVMRLRRGRRRVYTFGLDGPADVTARNLVSSSGQQTWTTLFRGAPIGNMILHLPGRFNVMNALGAMAAALAVGADPTSFAATLGSFRGIWRRFQILNAGQPVTVVSDYAHHPTAVRLTLEGARTFFPGRRIIAVFQPHHQSRLTSLFDDFAAGFQAANQAIILETYTVPGRDVPAEQSKSARQLAKAISQRGVQTLYQSSILEAEQQLQRQLKPGDVAVIMGAGDIWRMAERLGRVYV